MKKTNRPGGGAMFDNIAHRYDLLNRIMSLGLDARWRRKAVDSLVAKIPTGGRILDLATGTGDIALTIAKQRPDVTVVGVDPSENMLEIARKKSTSNRLSFAMGQAESLDFPDDSFDGAVMSFGIRNVPDRELALRELNRVLTPNGRLVLLELSEPKRSWWTAPSRFYVHNIVPRLGAILSGAKEYRYLQTSIEAFPPAEEFERTIQGANFESTEVASLMFGVAHIYSANKTPISA